MTKIEEHGNIQLETYRKINKFLSEKTKTNKRQASFRKG